MTTRRARLLQHLTALLLALAVAGAGAGALTQRRPGAPGTNVSEGPRAPGGKGPATPAYGDRLPAGVTAHAGTVRHAHGAAVAAVAFSPDGKLAASASFDWTLRLWDMTTGDEVRALRGHRDALCAAAFSPDGKVVASAGKDRTIRLWEVATGRELRAITGAPDVV